MNTRNLIEKLKSLGFKEYESKVFIVLLKGIPMSASEIAKEAKIIRNSIYDILKSFVIKGYCNEIETDTILNYQIIDPVIIMDKIQREYNDNYENRVVNLKDTFEELQTIYKTKTEKSDKADIGVQLIRGFNMHRFAKYEELLKNAKFEVLGMYNLTGAISDESNKHAINIIKSGGIIKSIYHTGTEFKIFKDDKPVAGTAKDLVKVLESFTAYGEDVRLSEVKLPNMILFDNETMFINLSGSKSIPKHKQADIIIKNPGFAEHMKDLFEFYWNKGLTIEEFKKKNRI